MQVLSFVMTLMVLFVSMDWDVTFHFCTVDHELTGSFGDASSTCKHCVEHHHDHHATMPSPSTSDAIQFKAKCCCDDFDELIHFSDNYTFSTEKPLLVSLPFVNITNIISIEETAFVLVWRCFTKEKIPYLITGRLKSIFFSNLKVPTAHPYGMPR